jgi:mannose-6-phosphate isomerase-like protein (cupin superfamily)
VNGVQLFESQHLAERTVFDSQFPSAMSSWSDSVLQLGAGDTHFGYVQSGTASLECDSGCFQLQTGMYFAIPGTATIKGFDGAGVVATRKNWQGFFHVGGPIENKGRLKYIDGCSDSLLIGPPVIGDPCLNLLHLPPNTRQTQHVHPSCRIGIIADGTGICRTSEGDQELQPGMLFCIAPDAQHSFHTEASALRVIAWHPDSDCGPNHHDHPMINRTMIDGRAASFRNLPIGGVDR